MDNNEILKKLRIAFSMKDTDVQETLSKADMNLSKTEINALFRKRGQRNFVPCGDQILRRFLDGIIKNERD
ncbi:DUF1456 family protein [Thiospirochaeta perfilievii]|uniref:DUF1456 family protein n=1 Tax=Thiospirochaeta perfilievii TaxID=252967 RepID=A0A5C1QDI8_9SPIO|nr:DUF1456 family protein [Thiospirochaeta perfilievii]QEN04716.1 DUF1456 family protein [Thiospirochaeta perfilievii]